MPCNMMEGYVHANSVDGMRELEKKVDALVAAIAQQTRVQVNDDATLVDMRIRFLLERVKEYEHHLNGITAVLCSLTRVLPPEIVQGLSPDAQHWIAEHRKWDDQRALREQTP